MPVTFKPRFALAAGWDIKENGWGEFMTQNICKLDNLLFPAVVSVGTPPPANNVGEQYIDASGNIQTFVDGAYVECAPKKGMFVYDCDNKCILAYDGTNWFDIIGSKATGGPSVSLIDDLTDVDTTGVADGQVLIYSTGTWIPASFPPPTTDTTGLTDIDLTGIADGQTVCWNAVTGQLEPANKSSGGVVVMDDLGDADTTTTAPVNGDILSYDGTNWVPVASTAGVKTHLLATKDNTQTPNGTPVVWDDIRIDTDSAMNTAGTTYVVPADGCYHVETSLGYLPTTNTTLPSVGIISFGTNGTTTPIFNSNGPKGPSNQVAWMHTSATLQLTAGDTIQIIGGGGITQIRGFETSWLSITKVGD